jgi:hypothetical protein
MNNQGVFIVLDGMPSSISVVVVLFLWIWDNCRVLPYACIGTNFSY